MSESAMERDRPQLPNELIDNAGFRWHFAPGGYRWVDQKAVYPADAPHGDMVPGRVLLPIDPLGPAAAEGVKYDPLAVSALFVTFANTPIDEEGLLGFANRFGCLGLARVADIYEEWPGTRPDASVAPAELVLTSGVRAVVPAERYATWREEVLAMKDSVDLWAMYANGERKRVACRLDDIVFGSSPTSARGAKRRGADDHYKDLKWLRCLLLCVNHVMPKDDRRQFVAEFLDSVRQQTQYLGRGHRSPREHFWDKASGEIIRKNLRRVLASAPLSVMSVALQLVRSSIDDQLRIETPRV